MPDEQEIRKMVSLLHDAYSAISAIERLAYGLDDPAYPPEATEIYNDLGEFLYPDKGERPEERWGWVTYG